MITMKTLHHTGTVAVVSLAALLGTPACALAAGVSLFIQNGDTEPVTVTLSKDNNWCYESNQTQLGQVWKISPGNKVEMFFWRVGGHGCDGDNGYFALQFNPPAQDYSSTHFQYSGDGFLSVEPKYANVYPGTLTMNSQSADKKTFTYTTVRLHEPVTAGKAIGHWTEICANICNYQHVVSETTTKTTTKAYTEEEKRAVTSSLEAGVDVEGVSLKGTLTTEVAKTIGHQMSDSFERAETFSDADSYVFTPEQMRDHKIYAVWQWVADTKLSNGSVATVRSRSFTCTPDGNAPQYLPGAPQDIKACNGS